jgi:hypothetical protein
VFLLPVQSDGARNGHGFVARLGENLTGVEVNNGRIVGWVGEGSADGSVDSCPRFVRVARTE